SASEESKVAHPFMLTLGSTPSTRSAWLTHTKRKPVAASGWSSSPRSPPERARPGSDTKAADPIPTFLTNSLLFILHPLCVVFARLAWTDALATSTCLRCRPSDSGVRLHECLACRHL